MIGVAGKRADRHGRARSGSAAARRRARHNLRRRRQRLNGLMLEHRPRRERKPRPPRPAHQLDRHDAVAAKLEEVVVEPRPARPPAPRQTASTASPPAACAAHDATATAAQLRLRQRPAVELAVRRQRQPLQHHQRRRHHVVRQSPRQRSPQRRRIRAQPPQPAPHSPPAAARRPPHPAAPPPRPPHTPACRNSTASISPGSIRNPRSFTCASARPRNSSTPSRPPPRQVSGPVHPRAGSRPCGSATNRSAVRPAPVQIPPRKTNPRDVQLTRQHPQGTGSRPAVQNVNTIIRQIGRPIGILLESALVSIKTICDRPNAAFGRTVFVDQSIAEKTSMMPLHKSANTLRRQQSQPEFVCGRSDRSIRAP